MPSLLSPAMSCGRWSSLARAVLLAVGAVVSSCSEEASLSNAYPLAMAGMLDAPVHWTLDPEGGEYEAGILTLAVPPGAVSVATEITLTTTSPTAAQRDGAEPLTPAHKFVPEGLTFAKPLRARLRLPRFVTPDEQLVVYRASADGRVEQLPFTSTEDRVIFDLDHFTEYSAGANKKLAYCSPAFRPPGCGETRDDACPVRIPAWRYPQSAQHIRDVLRKYPERHYEKLQLKVAVSEQPSAAGAEDDTKRDGANEASTQDAKKSKGKKDTTNRDDAMAAFKASGTQAAKEEHLCCLDHDEFPWHLTEEGGACAHMRLIDSSDNSGSGACVGAQIAGLGAGKWIEVRVVDTNNGDPVFDPEGKRQCMNLPNAGVPQFSDDHKYTESEQGLYVKYSRIAAAGTLDDFYSSPTCVKHGANGAAGMSASAAGCKTPYDPNGAAGAGGSAGSTCPSPDSSGPIPKRVKALKIEFVLNYLDEEPGPVFETAASACMAWIAMENQEVEEEWARYTYLEPEVFDRPEQGRPSPTEVWCCYSARPRQTEPPMRACDSLVVERRFVCPENSGKSSFGNQEILWSLDCECDPGFMSTGTACVEIPDDP